MAPILQEPKMPMLASSNQDAAKMLFGLQHEAGYVGVNLHFLVFWGYLHPANCPNFVEMKENNKDEHTRLRALFTATQWPDSPEEVAKVIRGELEVSNEIPPDLLKYLQSDEASDVVRRDFSYYLAYMASLIE